MFFIVSGSPMTGRLYGVPLKNLKLKSSSSNEDGSDTSLAISLRIIPFSFSNLFSGNMELKSMSD